MARHKKTDKLFLLIILVFSIVFLAVLIFKLRDSMWVSRSKAYETVTKSVELYIPQYQYIANREGNTLSFPTNKRGTVWIGTGVNTQNSYLGLWFSSSPLPPDAKVTSAKLIVTSNKKQSNPISVSIQGIKTPKPTTLTAANWPSTTSLTTAATTYSAESGSVWQQNSPQAIDVTSVIGELGTINNLGVVGLMIKGNGSTNQKREILGNPQSNKEPRLIVTYEIPVLVEPTPSPIPSPVVSPSPTPSPTSPGAKELRVMEVRYFPRGESDMIYHPNVLSANLRNLLNRASKSYLNVKIVDVFNRYTARPNIDDNWGTTYAMILAQDNLCQKIQDLDIDQIWLWVDPRPDRDPGPGVEYAISSNRFQHGLQYVTAATPAFCNGAVSFVMMGFDTTRTVDLALHSFGHYQEGLLGNLQTIELFWYRFGGNTSAGFPLPERCGNVHYPPNGLIDYDYANQTNVNNSCEDWHPDGSGNRTTINCTRWGCNQEGYLIWWMNNMPNEGNTLTYDGKLLPNWWAFTVDMDESISQYENNQNYFMNRDFLSRNP